MQINPFIYGRALAPNEFLGRKRGLRHVFGRLATSQSTAIIGQPHIGKTSLLTYIADTEIRRSAVGNGFDNYLFCFLDGQTLHGIETQAEFWQQAFNPLVDKLSSKPSHPLAVLYRTAEQNEFGTFVLEQLFRRMDKAGGRLVLLLDEFDAFLTNPVLHKAEFYGGLRSLASRFPALVLLIASRREVKQLNQLTQEINPHGSPYFNVFTEYHLGPLSNRAMAKLLRLGRTFKRDDRQFVWDMSGRHPYLAQTAAAMLWHVDADGLRGEKRYVAAGSKLYRQAKKHFADSWRVWTNATRRAVTTVSLLQMPHLAGGRVFDVGNLAEELDDFTPELERLIPSGLVKRDEEGEWHVTQHAFLWWLADELWRNVRDQTDFTTWLQRQTMDGVLTRGQQESLGNAVRQMLSYVEQGATTFIQAYAQKLASK